MTWWLATAAPVLPAPPPASTHAASPATPGRAVAGHGKGRCAGKRDRCRESRRGPLSGYGRPAARVWVSSAGVPAASVPLRASARGGRAGSPAGGRAGVPGRAVTVSGRCAPRCLRRPRSGESACGAGRPQAVRTTTHGLVAGAGTAPPVPLPRPARAAGPAVGRAGARPAVGWSAGWEGGISWGSPAGRSGSGRSCGGRCAPRGRGSVRGPSHCRRGSPRWAGRTSAGRAC